jgi:hypothetical protein
MAVSGHDRSALRPRPRRVRERKDKISPRSSESHEGPSDLDVLDRAIVGT